MTPPSRPPAQPGNTGFTLVEIMIVVVIIGLLAALAIPAFQRLHQKSRATAFINDLRIATQAVETYSLVEGGWPPDGSSGIPIELDAYLPRERWAGTTPLGGNWDWDYGQFGVTAGLSVRMPSADVAIITAVDRISDDGILTTGNFRQRGGGYIYVIQP